MCLSNDLAPQLSQLIERDQSYTGNSAETHTKSMYTEVFEPDLGVKKYKTHRSIRILTVNGTYALM